MAVVWVVRAEANAGLDRAYCGLVRLRDLRPANPRMAQAWARRWICVYRTACRRKAPC
jgi:hypothetical protein